MDAPNEDKYVAKYPMPEGGVIKSSGETMSQQEWDERSEGLKDYPETLQAIFRHISLRNKRQAEIKRRFEEFCQKEEDKSMMELGRHLVKLLIEKLKRQDLKRKIRELRVIVTRTLNCPHISSHGLPVSKS